MWALLALKCLRNSFENASPSYKTFFYQLDENVFLC